MMGKKIIHGKVVNVKKITMAVLAGTLLVLTACSSEETVLLEEDLVHAEEVSVGEDLQAGEGLTEPQDESGQEQVEQSTLFVHICGEVMNPGVYEMPAGSRIYEAVEAAGGFTEAASESYVNLAQVVEDGCKIEIPAQGEEPEADSMTAGVSGAGNTQQDGLVDINSATMAELCSLPGIGESRANSIIAYREKNGGFSRIEDIMKIEGIKEGMFDKMKDKICVRGVK